MNAALDATNPMDHNRNGLPPWMQAEKISIGERLEIWSYKLVTYIPVAVTMGLFSFLFVYYTYVSDIYLDKI